MSFFRNLFLFIFLFCNLNASMVDDIVFVENKDSKERTLKEEFLNSNTDYYTISIATLDLDKHDPIDYFKTYKLTNAVAYRYGENKEFVKVISGVYKTGTDATNDIKSLDPRLKRNKPYSAKIKRHQKLFEEYNGIIVKKEKKVTSSKKQAPLNETKDSIYIEDNENSIKLKKEFLTNGSNYYSIAIGSISLDKNSIQNFFRSYNIGDKALAHIYGKNRDKVRIIYGLYKTKKEAKEAIEKFNQELSKNKPFSMKMNKFQNFYNRFNKDNSDEMIVELKVNNREEKEKEFKPKLSDEIKVIKPIIEKKELKKELEPQKVTSVKKPEIKKQKIKKIEKKKLEKKRVIKKVDSNKKRYVKHSKLQDVYYVEEKGEFNILNEVFLNEGSSFYTVDLGELKLNETTIHQFFIQNSMENNALAYKYGDKKEYARVIYGAFETKEDAKNIAEKLNISTSEELKVSNIKNHQKLYKVYHKNKMEYRKESLPQKNINTNNYINSDYTIVYSQIDNNTPLKDEFFNRNSNKYTITLTTFLKDTIDVDKYFSIYGLVENSLAFPIGTKNSYYRVIYGVFDSAKEAKDAMSDLDENLRKNLPYVSKIRTNQKKFESHYGRKLESEFNKIQKIEFR